MNGRGNPGSEDDAGPGRRAPDLARGPADADTPSLGTRAQRGAFWVAAGYGASQLIRLGSNLILTRLLFPEAFGLMAVVNSVLAGFAMFSDLGLVPSVVQNRRGDDPRFLATAWTATALPS